MKKAIFYISTILAVAYVAAAFFWSDFAGREEKCRGIVVNVEDNGDSLKFVTRDFVLSEVKRLGLEVAGKPLSGVDTKRIEDIFAGQYYVERVQCYKRSDNSVQLDVVPVKPLLRVFDKTGSYYINRAGKRVPSISGIFADVPVARGNFDKKFTPARLLPLVDCLAASDTLRNLVSAIEVADSANIFIVPNIVGHVVNIGSLDNLDVKFGKLMRMYKEVLPVKGWNVYDTINLKWDNQVVATKRNAASRLWIQEENIGHDEEPEPLVPQV